MKSNNFSESLDRKRLEIVQRVGGIGYWEYDPTTKSIFLPEASQGLLASITGNPVNAPARFMRDLGNGGERLYTAFDQAMASHLAFQVELEVFDGDGNPAWLAFRGDQVELAPGLLGLAGTFRDISDEKRREADHLQSEVQLQAVFDSQLESLSVERTEVAKKLGELEEHFKLLTEDIADVFWKADSNLHITYISPVDQILRGYHASEVLGRHVFEILTEEGIAIIQQMLEKRRQAELEGNTDESIAFEVQHRCKDGRLVWGELHSRPVRDADGTIIGYHGITRETTKRRELEDQVRQLAFYDPLTHLPNRRLLSDRLNQSIAASQRNKRHCAMLVIDLDNFKPLNDLHGHWVGDLLLVEAALRLTGCVREVDTVARFGGDEFVVLLNDLDPDLDKATTEAGMVAEKIRVSLSAPYVLQVEHATRVSQTVAHRCFASIGVVLYLGAVATVEDIFKWADAAMYKAKAAGRNTIKFHD